MLLVEPEEVLEEMEEMEVLELVLSVGLDDLVVPDEPVVSPNEEVS